MLECIDDGTADSLSSAHSHDSISGTIRWPSPYSRRTGEPTNRLSPGSSRNSNRVESRRGPALATVSRPVDSIPGKSRVADGWSSGARSLSLWHAKAVMIFLGTSYIIALADSQDQWHHRALAWSHAIRDRLLTTEYVLWECVSYFSSPIDRSKAATIAGYLRTDRSIQFVVASPQLLDEGLRMHAARADKFWSLTDCVSFALMQRLGLRAALSADQHFEQAGFEALVFRDP